VGLDAALDGFWAAANARRLGIDVTEVVAGNGRREERRRIDDIRRDVFSVAEPGSAYHYSGGNTYVLGRVVHSVTGADLREFLLPRLFAPLGIRNPQWLRCPLGYSLGAIGLQLRTTEITRIAQLLLHQGSYDGHRLAPAGYIAQMTTDTTATGRAEPDNQAYGLHAWLCARDGAWRMDGIYGQFGIMLPRHNATVSITAHCRVPTTRILDCAWEHIVPALA
jgi:CubicO group peptidase (beta-lactamase class C family)